MTTRHSAQAEAAHTIEQLNQAIALGGEEGGTAQVLLAKVLFDLDRVDEARSQLDALRRSGLRSPVPYELAALMLEQRAEHQQALRWFNITISRLTAKEIADRQDFAVYANSIIAGRRRVRRTLGLPADQLDESIPEHSPFVSSEHLDAALAPGGPKVQRVELLFWPRAEALLAHERWPELVGHTDVDSVCRQRELANRDLAESGVAEIVMVPLTVAKLADFAHRTGGDPLDEKTRRGCMMEILDEGDLITWPPARNAPCWCGSGTRYKHCCAKLT